MDRHKKLPRICKNCGEKFGAARYQINRGEGIFCSRSCAMSTRMKLQYKINPPTGDKNPNWKGGISSNNYQYNKVQKKRWPFKWAARAKLRYAVRRGTIKRKPCEICGELKVHAHHDDYSKPLVVRWLCRKHHQEVHKHKI